VFSSSFSAEESAVAGGPLCAPGWALEGVKKKKEWEEKEKKKPNLPGVLNVERRQLFAERENRKHTGFYRKRGNAKQNEQLFFCVCLCFNSMHAASSRPALRK
jgi:hypothetical protein